MAGSLNHIVNDDGTFTKETVECGTGDCEEALIECHQIIAVLLDQLHKTGGPEPETALHNVLGNLGFPLSAVPIIEPELHGYSSVFREEADG